MPPKRAAEDGGKSGRSAKKAIATPNGPASEEVGEASLPSRAGHRCEFVSRLAPYSHRLAPDAGSLGSQDDFDPEDHEEEEGGEGEVRGAPRSA